MATHVQSGQIISSVRENNNVDELNNTVRRTGSQTMTGALNVTNNLQRHGQNVITDARPSGVGLAANGIVVVTQSEFSTIQRFNDIIYMIRS